MQTIIILSSLAFIAILVFVLVKSLQHVVKWYATKIKQIEEEFDEKYWSDSDD